MTIITTLDDVRNYADGIIGATTEDETEILAQYIACKAYDEGLFYGQDWGEFLKSLTVAELCQAIGVK